MMRLWPVIGLLLAATRAFGDVSVVATVDRNHVAFGESVTLTITVQGARNAPRPSVPPVDGLRIQYTGQSMQVVMGDSNSQSLSFTYQVMPGRTGESVIPAIEVNVNGKVYHTEPIKLVVEKGVVQGGLNQRLFARVMLAPQQAYLGQTVPINVIVFVRKDVPFHGLSGFQAEAEGLNCKYLDKVKQGSEVIDGESFSFYVIEGALTPTRVGALSFGPAAVKCQLRVPKRGGDDFFNQLFSQVEVQETTVPIDAVLIEVLPLPAEGRPADFAGAVGQWNLDVTAKPTEVAVGDPVTFTIKISGTGNVDTVQAPALGSLDGFKTYEPTIKTTKDDLNTTGERVIQQVLIPRSTSVKELPEVRLTYFDPAAKAYRTSVQPPTKLMVRAGSGGQSTIIGGGGRLRPDEKLGQDVVYLKGDLGPAAPTIPFYTTPPFWAMNIMPVLALFGGIGWKRRTDKLRGDVAYARRARAARNARKLLAAATSYDEVQRALQNYLGDRLNIPAGGITASIVDEQLVPRGVNGELATQARACFEVCDTARFAGGGTDGSVQETREKVEQLINELEKKQL